jgi:hypothetical protein
MDLGVIRNGGAAGITQLLHRGTGELQLTTQESGAIRFRTGGSDALIIDTSQNVVLSNHLELPYGEINDAGTDLNIVGTNAITLQSSAGTALTIANASTDVDITGSLTTEGPDGGAFIGNWAASSSFAVFGTANMAGGEYALLTDGTNTFLGSGNGGSTYFRGPGNDSQPELVNNGTNIFMQNAGNFGIGTSSPAHEMVLRKDQSAETELSIVNLTSNASATTNLRFRNATSGSETGNGGLIQLDNYNNFFINNQFGNPLKFGTSNTERMRIDGTGNVGIGTGGANPSAKLHVSGDSFFNGQLRGGFGAVTTGGTADWNHSTNARSGNGHTLLLSTATNGPGTTAVNTGNTSYYHTLNFEYASYDGDANMTQIGIPYYFANLDGVRPVIRSRYSGTWSQWHSIPIANQNGSIQGSKGSASNPSYVFNQGSEISEPDTGMFCPGANMIGFSTGGTEKMRITSAGRVLIGGTSASGHNYDFEVLDNHAFVKGPDGWNGTGDLAIVALGSAVVNEVFGCGYKYGTGMILSTYKTGGYGSFGSSCQDSLIIADTTGQAKFINDVVAFATSDKRLKENVKSLDNALDKINKINGVEFDWIEGKDKHGNSVHSNEGHDIGVIAQEIEEVLPEVVTTRDNGYKAVKYEKIVPLLIQAIKEQQKQIEELKNG